MVPCTPLYRAGDRVGRALCVALTLVLAGLTIAMWHVSVKQAAILHVLNGGCLQ